MFLHIGAGSGAPSGRGTAAAAMVHSVLADDDSFGVFGTSKHTDSYIQTNNRRVKKELEIFPILLLVAGLGRKGLKSVLRIFYHIEVEGIGRQPPIVW